MLKKKSSKEKSKRKTKTSRKKQAAEAETEVPVKKGIGVNAVEYKEPGDSIEHTIERELPDQPTLNCPDCGSTSLITDYKHGELVCPNCGLVLEDGLFDFGPEWRAFDEEQKSKRARTGGPVKFAKLNKGLTTEIDRYDRDIRGGAIQPERKAQLYRLRKWQRRSRMSDSVQRNLSIALPELDRMCAYLNIPNNIKEECAMWYRKAVNKGLVRGRSIESVVAAIIYLISRKHQLPKTLEELEEASGVKKKDIGRSYRFSCRKLGLRMPVATPMDYVPRFASELGLSGETEAKAIEILQKAREKGVTSGRGPTGVAAAAIYLAGKITNDKQTQKGIAGRLAGVTEVTIRNRYEEIARELGIEI
jgi:transcription initiation factor TFIIB